MSLTQDPQHRNTASLDDAAAPGLRPTVFWRMANDIPSPLRWTLIGLSVLIPLCAWGLIASLGNVNPKFLPAPLDVVEALVDLASRGLLLKDTWASITRVSFCLLYTSPSPRDLSTSRMPSSA